MLSPCPGSPGVHGCYSCWYGADRDTGPSQRHGTGGSQGPGRGTDPDHGQRRSRRPAGAHRLRFERDNAGGPHCRRARAAGAGIRGSDGASEARRPCRRPHYFRGPSSAPQPALIALDTSALLKRYVAEPGRDAVLEAMSADPVWCASALCGAEAEVTLCHLGLADPDLQSQRLALRADWQRFYVVPVDDLCLGRAAEIGCDHRVRTLDAVHLAAAERLPRPLRFLTFDRRQAAAARALGFE